MKTPKILEATTVTVGMCDFCPAVHVNLRDEGGTVFATASIPIAGMEQFIAMLRDATKDRALRADAPVKTQ